MRKAKQAGSQITHREVRTGGLIPTKTQKTASVVIANAMVAPESVACHSVEPNLTGKTANVGIVAVLTTTDIFTENGNFGVNIQNNFSIFPDTSTNNEVRNLERPDIAKVNDSILEEKPKRVGLTRRDSFGLQWTNVHSFFKDKPENSKAEVTSTSSKPGELVSEHTLIAGGTSKSSVSLGPQSVDEEEVSFSLLQLP